MTDDQMMMMMMTGPKMMMRRRLVSGKRVVSLAWLASSQVRTTMTDDVMSLPAQQGTLSR